MVVGGTVCQCYMDFKCLWLTLVERLVCQMWILHFVSLRARGRAQIKAGRDVTGKFYPGYYGASMYGYACMGLVA